MLCGRGAPPPVSSLAHTHIADGLAPPPPLAPSSSWGARRRPAFALALATARPRAARFASASAGLWPPDRKTTPGSERGTVRCSTASVALAT
jgi:hypothetical protein